MDQFRIPCVIMRAGTSKGIFLKENDLPAPGPERDKIVLGIFGSPDKRQIDGLAGADPLTSKLAIVGPGSVPGADVDYTFAQVSITDAKVDWNGNCGNISSGVAPFAIDESIVRCHEGLNEVTIWQTNTQKMMKSYVLVENGKAKVTGDAEIAGVPGTAAPIQMDMSGTAGAATGKLLPTGNVVDIIETSRGPIECSIVDCANPVIFVRAESVGMKGTEDQQEIDGNAALLQYLEEIRGIACVKCGMAKDLEDATKNSPAFPMVAFITEAQDYYYPPEDKTIKKEDVDLVSRLMFMQVLHKTYAGTATVCTGVAAKIKGTLVNQVLHNDNPPELVRIGHPAGMIPCYSEVDENNNVKKAAIVRTARRLMEGYALLEKAKYQD